VLVRIEPLGLLRRVGERLYVAPTGETLAKLGSVWASLAAEDVSA
jgi:hypothetical protein